jgi:hypothetical protein
MSNFDEFEKEFEKIFESNHEQDSGGNDLEEEFKKLFGPPDHLSHQDPVILSETQQELVGNLGGQQEAAALEVEAPEESLDLAEPSLGDAFVQDVEPQLADFSEAPVQVTEDFPQVDEPNLPSPKTLNLQEITLEQLQQEIDEILIKVYNYFKSQTDELLGYTLPEKSLPELYDTELGRYFSIITQVLLKDGQIKGDAVFAVNKVLPLLWKAVAEQEYRIPEEWYETDLGYLCRYIKVGNDDSTFDPIDLSAVAVILDYTEDQVIEQCKELGGVKLPTGYVFSRRKVEEFKMHAPILPPPPPLEMLQEFQANCTAALKKIITVHRFLANSYLELKQVQTILQTSMNYKNEVPQKVKLFVDGKLAKAYQAFMDVSAAHSVNTQLKKGEFLTYSLPNVFEPIMNYSGGVLGGMQLVQLLTQSIDLIEQEQASTEAWIERLTKELGQLSTEIEVLKIKESL